MKKQSKRKAAPKKLRAIQTSRHLHVAHHRHTGHVTPHHTTSYPILAMIVLIVGVLMGTWTSMVKAVDPTPSITDSYKVKASVEGTAPTQVPTIEAPVTAVQFQETPITITGTCQLKTYITLYRNSVASGVAICDAKGKYSISSDLFVGKNQLQVRVFSPTDQAGPYSEITTIYYYPPRPVVTDSDQANPLLLRSDFTYKGYYTDTSSPWQLSVGGGTPPYAIAVDWGDGQRELVSKATAGEFSMEHVYKKAGGYQGNYTVTFTATDTKKAETQLQLLAIINDPHGGAVATTGNGNITAISDNGALSQIMKYAWSGYGVSVLMLASFWLGEHRELQQLARLRPGRHA